MKLEHGPKNISEFSLTDDGCIIVTASQYDPYTIYNGTGYHGPCVDVFDLIMKELGFCYRVFRKGFWGSILPNGSWTGMVGILERHEAEAALCPYAMNHPRFQVSDFSEIIIASDYSIVYPRPDVKPNISAFILPFTMELWGSIVGLFLFLTAMSASWVWLANNVKSSQDVSSLKSFKKKYWNMPYTWVYRAILAQPNIRLPKSYGGRMIVFLWLFFGLIFSVLYRCNLKALLIVPKVDVPFVDLEGLINYGKYKWSFLIHSVLELYFEPAFHDDPDSVMGRAWSGRGELYTRPNQIVPFVVERGMACISITHKVVFDIARDFTRTGKCRMAVAPNRLIQLSLMYGFPKGSRMKGFMDPYIMALNEFGILNKMFSEGSQNATTCMLPPGKESNFNLKPLGMGNIGGPLLIYVGGMLLASMSLIGEMVSYRFVQLRREKRRQRKIRQRSETVPH